MWLPLVNAILRSLAAGIYGHTQPALVVVDVSIESQQRPQLSLVAETCPIDIVFSKNVLQT
ncbi:hypothetical protein SAE02_77220 [Skermanella aerolata]|uniref:Uncharacterized protein n=1 Tax=Skermanella aerolata TaxID=393310 RepID=A0A512E4A3_9PROT|nr:hypothetical protein SAE02_77220 [Skermanella aerolata]